uniref:Uncharacterized protein n=1 Tax=Chromera velia CCMP2878 TaxID=1169474 RepID=A0A0G4HFQ9_9ALVE|eukprot:Cvel_27157.t1-p1 / transcript=Cvel_27157.t1 / gene=Cvel_27157 / organism=Chromera_velia_CCMP2878 / gene_product=hypothetical protein / transcript_product=hypothetical protein / location=Cvel_scaffold3343:7340-13820(+) / protein_length=474 / sequence_SO=supercontig / SO=protein_coding / is_pseudo=false
MKEEGELHSQSNERISVQPDALLSLPPEDFFFEQMQIKPPRGLDKRAPRGVPKHLRRGAPARVELPPPKRRSASLDWRGKRGVFDMPLQRAVEKYTARGLLTEEKEQNLKARRGLRCRFREASVERERPSRSEAPKVPQLSVAEDSLSHCLAYVVPSSFRQGNGFKRDGLKGSQRNEAITKGKAREKKRGRGEVKRESVNTEMIRQEVKNAIAMTQRRSRKKEFVQSHDGHPADNGGQGVPVRESTHEGAADVFDKTVTALTDENRNVEPNENLAETTGSQMSPPPRCNLKTLYGRARKGDAHPVTVLEPPSYSQQQQGSGNTAGRGGHRERGHLSPGGGAGAGGHGVPPSPRQALRAEFRLPSSVWQERVEGSRDRERVLHRRPSQPLVEAVDSMRRESRGGFTAVAESLLKAHERQAERVEEASRLLEGLSTNRLTTLLQQRGKGARLGTLLSISVEPTKAIWKQLISLKLA